MSRTRTKPVESCRGTFSTAAALAGYDDGRLQALLLARPDLVDPAPPTTYVDLAHRVTAIPSARAAYVPLDRGTQQVAEAMCLLPEPASLRQLADLLGVSPGDLARPLDRLADVALAFRDGSQLYLNPGLRSLPYPAGLGPPVADALARQTVPDLARICRALGTRAGATKAATLEAIAHVLSDERRLNDLLAKAPAGTDDLARRVARLGPTVTAGYGYQRLGDNTSAGWLANRGLLATVTWDQLIMPAEPALALRGGRVFFNLSLHPPELPRVAVDADGVDASGAEQALRAVADVATLLDAWSVAPPKLLKDGGLGIREVRRAAQAIERDERNTAVLIELAAAAGLVTGDIAAGLALPLPACDDWCGLEAPDRWGWLVEAWVTTDLHPSFAGAISTKDKPIPPLLHRGRGGGAQPTRRLLLDAMAEVATGEGTEVEALADRARWTSPATWHSALASAEVLAEWVSAEAEVLGVRARGSLTTAGRLAAAGALPDAVSALAARAPATVSELVLQADLTAVAAGSLAPALAAEMELLADVESRGAATVYRFSEASLRRGLDAGHTADDILAFLDQHSRRDVPQPLSYLVGDLGRRFGRVRIGAARCYLRSDDASLLAEVLAARATQRLGLRPLAPTVAVADADTEVVLTTLRAAGYLPAEEDRAGGIKVSRPVARRAAPRPGWPGSPRPADGARAAMGAIAEAFATRDGDALRSLIRGGNGDGRRSLSSGDTLDPAAVVAALRRSPPTEPQRPGPEPLPPLHLAPRTAAATRRAALPPPSWEPPVLPPWDEREERPIYIAKGPEAVRVLLDKAYENDWMVRMSYVNGKGQDRLLNAVVVSVGGGRVVAECPPRWDVKTLNADRIEWARVLTESEEDPFL